MKLMKSIHSRTARLFAAEAAYAESIFRDAIGDTAASLAALCDTLTLKPAFANRTGQHEFENLEQVISDSTLGRSWACFIV